MASQVLEPLEVDALQTAVFAGTCADSAWVPPFADAPSYVRGPDCASQPAVVDGSCLKGVAVALSIEAAMVLTAYGVWHLLHVVR